MKEQKKQKSNLRTAITMILLIILIICFTISLIYTINTITAKIEFKLIGEESIILEVGTNYTEPGVITKNNGKNISNLVNMTSNINTNIVGEYEVNYSFKIPFSFINKNLSRKVTVKDTTPPELKIEGKKEVTIKEGNKYSYPTYTAIDNYDKDITNNVKVETNLDTKKPGTYEINYSITDSNNNETKDKVVVNVKGKNPYIVVSISNQTLKYYEYDKLVLSSNVVTGINGKTPTGTFQVLNKIRNIVLKGEDYESFVSYWIAFKGSAFGFHDASWRSQFGGNIYKYNGSHGCVNMPYSKVKALYEIVEIGTPVYIKK